MERENKQNASPESQSLAAPSQKRIEELFERTLERYHGWHDMSARYVYIKEKIIGKTGKKGKKNICQWIETNEIYDGLSSRIKADRDYWMSAGEVSEGIKDKSGTPVLREKWLTEMKCHFLILGLEEASQLLRLNFTLTLELLGLLVIEHCRQRRLAVPMMWEDGEELTLLWVLDKPYYKEKSYCTIPYYSNYGEENKYVFNERWTKVQTLLYEDFRRLGARKDKKHAVTMLRVPGTLNTRLNKRVRVLSDGQETSASAIREVYVETDRHPLAAVKYERTIEEYQEYQKFSEAIDETLGTREPESERKTNKKAKAQPSAKKAKNAKKSKKKLNLNIEEFKGRISETPELKEIPLSKWKDYDKFIEELRKDILLIHSSEEEYVSLCLEKNKTWQSIWVKGKDLKTKLTELWLRPDFVEYNIYDTQAGYYRGGSRKSGNVSTIRVSFLDLDSKLVEENKDLSAEEWVEKIKTYCEEKGIPQPTIIVFSGNGIHVKWVYKEAVRQDKFRIWHMLEKKLCKLFGELGADSKATDLARVLRVPGTQNCKEGTVDRQVRVLSFKSELYDFDELVKRINDLVPIEDLKLQGEIDRAELEALAIENEEGFYIQNETTGQTDWVKAGEMSEYLSRQDAKHVLRMSIAEFRGKELKAGRLKRIYCNAVQLSWSAVPGQTLAEKADFLQEHRYKYWKGAFCAPTEIMRCQDELLLVWRYVESDYLLSRALSIWTRTQEDLCEYYADWGAKADASYQGVTALLPVAGYCGTESEVIRTGARYTFAELSKGVLPYTRDEVKKYKADKPSTKRKATRWKSTKKGESFEVMALRRFKDIKHLIELRQDKQGEVARGNRELCVFWGMDCAVQAGLVSSVEEFNAMTESLIEKCGVSFQAECDANRLVTLREMFKRGESYQVTTAQLLEDLGITAAEEAELEVLRTRPKREKKTRKPSLSSLKPWELEGISERTWYRRRKAARDRVRTGMITKIIERLVTEGYASGSKCNTILLGGLKGVYVLSGVLGRMERWRLDDGRSLSKEIMEKEKVCVDCGVQVEVQVSSVGEFRVGGMVVVLEEVVVRLSKPPPS